jgi:hypothetical protein
MTVRLHHVGERQFTPPCSLVEDRLYMPVIEGYAIYCTLLYRTVLYCTGLYCTVLYCQ